MTDDCLPLPALTLGQIAELFPEHAVTVARWRTTQGKSRLPDPDFVPAGNQKRALWAVSTIVEWAQEQGKEVDSDALARIVNGTDG